MKQFVPRTPCSQTLAERRSGSIAPAVVEVLMARKVRLLNVDIDDITMEELLDSFDEGMLLTLHVDMIVKLQRDRDFFEILPRFRPITCDSQILMAAARALGTPLRE